MISISKCRSSLRDLDHLRIEPGIEMPGYYHCVALRLRRLRFLRATIFPLAVSNHLPAWGHFHDPRRRFFNRGRRFLGRGNGSKGHGNGCHGCGNHFYGRGNSSKGPWNHSKGRGNGAKGHGNGAKGHGNGRILPCRPPPTDAFCPSKRRKHPANTGDRRNNIKNYTISQRR